MFGSNDNVVLVTGAGSGIGREIALTMAAHGARVVVNDIGTTLDGTGENPSAAKAVVEEILAAGGTAVPSTDSVASWDSAQSAVQTAIDAFGRIDAVVNNAGIVRDRIFHKMSVEEWQKVVDVHLNGSFFIARAAAPHFRAANAGRYVHITSTSGLIGSVGQANYAAAKLGIVGLSASIARDMRNFGVHSNCIAPFAWSRMTNSIPTDDPAQAARVEKLKRMAADKVAPLAVFLASPSSTVSGQIFAVRANEIMLMNQHRPIRTMHRAGGWSAEAIGSDLIPALQPSFTPLDVTTDVISWDPI